MDKAYDDPTNTKYWGNHSGSIPWATLGTTWESYGVIWPETAKIPYKGGYYPAAGWRQGIKNAEGVSVASCHSASTGHDLSPSYTTVKTLYLTNPGFYSAETHKHRGLSVRCVTE